MTTCPLILANNHMRRPKLKQPSTRQRNAPQGGLQHTVTNGTPTTIYDVGSAPVRIVETDAYLYVMTTTRFYVLQGDCLIALEDCSDKCDLLVFEKQVLLVEAKGVRVFTHNGRPLGIALTKAPIRRAYVEEGDLVIETRTHRGRFRGIRPSPGA